MTVRLGIVTNPFDPSTWEDIETDDICAEIAARFPTWPNHGRIYDLEGFGDWTRAAALMDRAVLSRRDVTPRDEAGVERLGRLKGPLMVSVPPGDPLTAILTVVALAVGVAAAFLLVPKINVATQRAQSPNNSLSERTNQPRLGGRVADIFGTVESTPDLLMVPYTQFDEAGIEVEVAYMAVGRGSYAVTRVRDGDTSIASIAGASAAIYGPFTSPNSGDAPQLQIGSAIDEVVQTVIKLNEVNGQTLKPTNLNFVQGEDSIRFVYPDTIETNDPDIDLTQFFAPGNTVTVAQADIEGEAGTDTTETNARFFYGGEIDFETVDPTTLFAPGDPVTLSRATYAGDTALGGTLYVDLDGTYTVDSFVASEVFDFSGGALPAEASFTRASTGRYFNGAGVLSSAAIDVARFDRNRTAPFALRGLLIEPAATNSFINSDTLASAVPSNCALSTDGTKGPDGATNAQKLTATAGTASFVQTVAGAGAAGGNSFSIFVKKGTSAATMNRFLLRNGTTATNLLNIGFDYDTGVITYFTGAAGASAEQLTGGWWRLTLSATAGIAAGNQLLVYMGGVGQPVTSGDYCYLIGGQLESGGKPTSYIPTAGAAANRSADALVIDAGDRGLPDGAYTVQYTFDNATTQNVAGTAIAGGTFAVPTTLNRQWIKSAAVVFARPRMKLLAPATENSDWNLLDQYPAEATGFRNAEFSTPTETTGINLNGTYTALAVSAAFLTLNNPNLVNAAWNNLDDLPGGATDYVSASLSRSSESWAGPFIVDLDDGQKILANVVAPSGLYTLSKKKGKQVALSVDVVLEVTPINSNDAAIGPAELFPATMIGSMTEKEQVGFSVWAEPSFAGRSAVRMRRTSPSPLDDDYGAIVDEVKWRDCFGLAPIEETEFGDMTTVMTRTIATPGALSLKQRKLNMRVTRKLPARTGPTTFGALTATDSAADIIAAMCLDPYIGRRSIDEIDVDSIYDTIDEVRDYFGADEAGEFGYTFDDSDVSFEETVQTVAQAVFCTAYRQGRLIRLKFERATNDSTLIFNSRNTLPRSQKRSVRFGALDDHDGVELDYTDPEDGAQLTYNIPNDRSAISPRSAEIVGVRSFLLAYWQAWRVWNKLRYQNIALELEATQEAALVLPKDRVLISDLTSPDVLDGDVEAEDGTTLTLSNPAPLDPAKTYTIFLQHIDGTTEPLGVTGGTNPRRVTLSNVPRMALSVDPENYAKATYMIVADDDVRSRAFLITEREANRDLTESVRAVNYSFLYYQHDQLALWLDFGASLFTDSSPYFLDGTPIGGATTFADPLRGTVYSGAGAGRRVTFPAFSPPTSYTKAAWIRRADLVTAGSILGNANERFGFAASADLQAGHGGVSVSAPWPAAAAWHHAAVCYDADLAAMELYIDGKLVDFAEGVAGRALAQVVALDGLSGRADDLRLWTRALSGSEILAVYLGSKIS